MGRHSGNEIYVHTDKGEYVGGDVIYGNVLLSIIQPVQAKSLLLTFKGYEKTEWIEVEKRWEGEGDHRHLEEVHHKREAEHDFFKDIIPLFSCPGGFPLGQFSYPFQYRLPDSLPGVFYKKGKRPHPLKAKITYKVKAELDISHGKDLKVKQHIFIHEKLHDPSSSQRGLGFDKTKQVLTCCCFPRGKVRCVGSLDKIAFMSGEVAGAQITVMNGSTVAVKHFNTKLIRYITLRDKHGHRHNLRDVIAEARYEGTGPNSEKESSIPLHLVSRKDNTKYLQPSTASRYVICEYKLMIELDIPFAPDLEIYVPVVLYAPQNSSWATFAPPEWMASATLQSDVNPQYAVSSQVLASQSMGYFHQEQPAMVPQQPPQQPQVQVDFNMDEKAPLLH